MQSLINKFNLNIFFRTQILLNLILGLIPHIILHTKIKTQLLIFFMHIMRQTINFNIFHLLQILYLLQQLLNTNKLIILIFKQLHLQTIQLILSKQTHIVQFIFIQYTKVKITLL